MPRRLAEIKAEAESQGWVWDDWVRSEADEKALLEGYRPNPPAAEHVRQFCERYTRHSKGHWAGQPFTLLEWQWEDVVRPLFGWKRPDGTRRFRMGFLSVAKKNGKSALMSTLGLYGLVADNEPGAEVFSAAADRDQAAIVFGESANMVESSHELQARLEVVRSRKRIVYRRARSFYQALSADVPNKEGLNAHYILFDELHAQRTRDLFDTLRYAGAARRQPLFLMVTTAGYDRHSICYEQYDYAKKVLAGITEDLSFFVYIAEAADDDDWKDEEVWRQANPSLGVTITLDSFTQDFREAQDSVTKENRFRRYRLNQWTEQDVRWLKMEKWDACATPVDAEALVGQECYAGLDLAVSQDLNALVLLFPKDDEEYILLPFFWAPRECAIQRERRDRAPYLTWARQGLIELTDGDVADYQVIRRRINELANMYAICELAVDRLFQGVQLCTELGQDGLEVVPFGQGYYSMAAPTAEFERLLIGRKLAHGGHPILRWMASNVTVETDSAGNIKPSKKKSTERIDGIVAAVMALGRAMLRTEEGSSVYETRGMVVL